MGNWAIQASGAFQDLQSVYGFKVTQMPGAGVAPVNNRIIDYATLDGGFWQSKRFESRTFTLVGVISGSNLADLHSNRARLIADLEIAASTPTVLRYSGANQTVTASAYYDGGLEIGRFDAAIEADLALRFVMPSGGFVGASSQATLATQSEFAFNNVFRRKQTGEWDAMGSSAYSSDNVAKTPFLPVQEGDGNDGAYIIFGTSGCSVASLLCWHNESWQTSYAPIEINAGWLEKGPGASSVFIGGNMNSIGGSLVHSLGKIDGGNASVYEFGLGDNHPYFNNGAYLPAASKMYLLVDNATDYYTENGASVAASALVTWTEGASSVANFASFRRYDSGTGSTNAELNTIKRISSTELFITGPFDRIDSSASGAYSTVTIYNSNTGLFGTMNGGLASAIGYDRGVVLADNSILIASCSISQSVAGASMTHLARWNGFVWSDYGGTFIADPTVLGWSDFGGQIGRKTGKYYLSAPMDSVNGIVTDNHAIATVKNGWLVPLAFILPVSGSFPTMKHPELPVEELNTGELLFAMGAIASALTGSFPGYTAVSNSAGDIYPVFSASGPGRIYQLSNFAVGTDIFFNYDLQSGEVITLDFSDPLKQLTSNINGNITSKIAQGSDVSSWRLTNGSNHISCYISGGAGSATLTWAATFVTLDN